MVVLSTFKKYINEYEQNEWITFTFNSGEIFKENKNIWDKDPHMPFQWNKITKQNKIDKSHNTLAIITGQKSNLFVIDIDNINHWNDWLNNNNFTSQWNDIKNDIITVKSGKGGKHLYFRYDDSLKNIKNASKCFGNGFDIDIRTTNGCIYAPPTHIKTTNLDLKYIWEIKNKPLIPVPDWIKNYLNSLIENKNNIKKNINNNTININNTDNIDIDNNNDIKQILDLYNQERCDNMDLWLAVGMNLKIINNNLFNLYDQWSQKSNRYNNQRILYDWNSFNGTGDITKCYNILKKWAKEDNPILFNDIYGDDNLLNEEQKKIIFDFIKECFHYPISWISKINIKKYDDNKYIFLNIKQKLCKFINDEHDSFDHTYISIGINSIKEKCRTCDNDIIIINYDKYTDDLKKILNDLLIPSLNIEETFQDLLKNVDDFEIKKMDQSISNMSNTLTGIRFDFKNNYYCPIHKCNHSENDNCLFVHLLQKRASICCKQQP